MFSGMLLPSADKAEVHSLMAQMALGHGLYRASVLPPAGRCVIPVSALVFTWCSPLVRVCLQISSFQRDTSLLQADLIFT